MMRSPKSLRFIGALVVVTAATVLMTGVAGSVPLKDVHQGSRADCVGSVEWHFVHNQTDADSGTITVGSQQVANGAPFEAKVLHYWVTTDNNVLPTDVADDVAGGKLVLSHYTCIDTSTCSTSSTSTSTTTTTTTTEKKDGTTSTSSTTTSTTTTTEKPDDTTATTEKAATTTTEEAKVADRETTTTTVATQVLPTVVVADSADPIVAVPTFTG